MTDYPQLVQNISCSLPIFGFPGQALSLVIPRNTWPGMTESTLPATILFSEPSVLAVNITDGSVSRAEPSTLDTEIVEGSIFQDLTIHAKCLYHGRFDGINMNLPRWRSISRTVQSPERNLPRWIPKSWKVPSQKAEPSTIMHRIVDGP